MSTIIQFQSGFAANTTTVGSQGFEMPMGAMTCPATQINADPMCALPRSDRGRLPRKAESALRERDDTSYRSDMMEARQRLGQAMYKGKNTTLTAIRLSRGFSQQQVATASWTSQPAIAKIEAGAVNLSRDLMRRLIQVLGINMIQLDDALAATEAAAKAPAAVEVITK